MYELLQKVSSEPSIQLGLSFQQIVDHGKLVSSLVYHRLELYVDFWFLHVAGNEGLHRHIHHHGYLLPDWLFRRIWLGLLMLFSSIRANSRLVVLIIRWKIVHYGLIMIIWECYFFIKEDLNIQINLIFQSTYGYILLDLRITFSSIQ